MPSYVVQGRDPRRIATAVVLYQLLHPRLAFALVVTVAVFAAAGALSGASAALAGALIAVVVIVVVIEHKRRQLARQLARRGFRPGSTIFAEADPKTLVVTGPTGVARYPWEQVEQVRVLRGIVVFRLAGVRLVIVVPVTALPDGAVERMG